MKKTKQALFNSVVALILCFSMLVGTTFAWFTDEVNSSMNQIVAGNLDVELLAGGEKVDENTELFELEAPNLWEPGMVVYENLTVVNVGTLALKWQMALNFGNENDLNGHKLSEVLQIAIIDEVMTGTTREQVLAAAKASDTKGALSDFYNNGTLEAKSQSETFAVVIFWEPGENDNDYNANNGKETSDKKPLHIEFGIRLQATQMTGELDSFGPDYDAEANFPEIEGGDVIVKVTTDNGLTNAAFSGSANGLTLAVPAGVKTTGNTLTLSVDELATSGVNITPEDGQMIRPLDVHVSGVAGDNTQPMTITIEKAMMKGLNLGNYTLYHVEDGVAKEMELIDVNADFTAHNQFKYDPATGDVTLYMATFSEVALVAEPAQWEGKFDYTWYDASKTELTIANADQLAGFGAIVGGMNGQTRDSFSGKTVKLIADINLGDKDNANESLIFHPIGYYYTADKNADGTTGDYYSTVYSFEGTFDGNGNTISSFYQNTWEIKGDYDGNYYKDAMGLFGYVVNGTIKNLTVDNFSSDGEFTPTGVIAAYAVNSTFENIAITNCNPRVYNTGNGGIIGIAGRENEAVEAITLKNITVDNSNKITALWGSWDVACGGLVGMYRGNVDSNGEATGDTITFTNCHVAAQIDVYNDVCANYQYYAYRYSGMIIGSVRHNTRNGEGKTIPNMTGISATNCTVNYGDWNDYYYCEFEKNTMASYSEDYQFSRVPHSELNFTDSNGNGVVDADERASVTGCKHTHTAEENHQAIYLPFHQLFTGYSWGVSSIGLEKYSGVVTNLDIIEGDQNESVEKFETKFTGDFLYRVGNLNTVSIGSLFAAMKWDVTTHGASLKDEEGNVKIYDSGVHVKIEKINDDMNVSGTFKANTSDWTKGTIQFSGTGVVKVTIQDYNFCTPTVLLLEVVDAKNTTTASFSGDTVLLNNVSANTEFNVSNSTIYGNGFEIDISGAPTNCGTNTNYSVIGLRDATIDNVIIKGAVYQNYGVTANSDYSAAAIGASGNSKITNSCIMNCLSPVKALSGTLTIENTTLRGGRFCNLDVRGAHVILDGVTTINTSAGGTKAPDGKVLGMGIVVYYQNADNAKITIGEKGLTQHNWLYIDGTDTRTGDYQYFNASGLTNAFDMMFGIQNKYTVDGKTYVNAGILSLNTTVDENDLTIPNGYVKENVTYASNDGYLWTPGAYNQDALNYEAYVATTQGDFLPMFKWNHPEGDYAVDGNQVSISFNEGESYTFDTTLPTAIKSNTNLPITVKKDGVVCDGTVTFTASGEHVFSYEYTDPFRYNKNGSVAESKTYVQTLVVKVSAIELATPAPTFTFVTQSGTNEGAYAGTYSGQAGLKDGDINGGIKTIEKDGQLWIMPNVTAADTNAFGSSSTNGMKGSIGYINGVYFPIITGATDVTTGSVISNGTVKRHYPFYGMGNTSGSITIEDGGVTYSSVKPSANLLFYSEYDGTQGIGVGSADDFGLAEGKTSSGATCTKCKWGITSGAISGGDATNGNYGNNVDSIYYAKFSYTAVNGQTYYYYVGFAFAQDTSAAKQESCVTADTLVTLADGTQKRIDTLTAGDKILAWDFFAGTYVEQKIALLVNHGEDLYRIANLEFSDGTLLRIIGDHGVFDYDLNKFVYITVDNMQDFVGHRFVQYVADGSYNIVTLTNAFETEEYTSAWSITSAGTSNAFASGLLTVAPPEDFYNWIEMDGKLTYDVAQFQQDVETYGLYTYEDFADYVTYEQFVDWNGAYLKIAVEKGYFTFEYILELIELYKGWMPNN